MNEKERIRVAFPKCIAFADAVREEFGPDVKLIYLREGGRERGDPGDPADAARTVDGVQMQIAPSSESRPGGK